MSPTTWPTRSRRLAASEEGRVTGSTAGAGAGAGLGVDMGGWPARAVGGGGTLGGLPREEAGPLLPGGSCCWARTAPRTEPGPPALGIVGLPEPGPASGTDPGCCDEAGADAGIGAVPLPASTLPRTELGPPPGSGGAAGTTLGGPARGTGGGGGATAGGGSGAPRIGVAAGRAGPWSIVAPVTGHTTTSESCKRPQWKHRTNPKAVPSAIPGPKATENAAPHGLER